MTASTKPPKLATLPTAVVPPEMAQPRGLVTALQVVGRGVELRLSPERQTFTIGSGNAVDLRVGTPEPKGRGASQPYQIVSKIHAQLTRKLNGLLVSDVQSRNGIAIMGERRLSGEVIAGHHFTLGVRGGETLLALDELLIILRTEVAWALGFSAHAAVDHALMTIADGRDTHVALLGEPGGDQADLADAIHRTSARRRAAFVRLQPDTATEVDAVRSLAQAEHGTAYLDLHEVTRPLPRAFVGELLAGSIRTVVSAASADQLAHRFGARHAAHFQIIDVPRIADRRDDVERLLDKLLLRAGSRRSIGEMGDDWLAGISGKVTGYAWPQNIDGLRKSLPRWLALIETGSQAAAAERLGITHQAMSDWLKRFFKKVPAIPAKLRPAKPSKR